MLFKRVRNSASLPNTPDTIIVGIGGDGLLYEILNAVFTHKLYKATLAEVPCGSGNGFFKSITTERGVPCTVDSSVHFLQHGTPRPCDLLLLKNRGKYLRLGVAWGIISDLDIETEWMRRIGSTRFTLGAIYYCLLKRGYEGSLRYRSTETGQWVEVCGTFYYFWATSVSHGAHDIMCSPGATSRDGSVYISFLHGSVNRCSLAQLLLNLESGSHVLLPSVQYVKATEFVLTAHAGTITVDGEALPAESPCTQVHVVTLPGAMQFLS